MRRFRYLHHLVDHLPSIFHSNKAIALLPRQANPVKTRKPMKSGKVPERVVMESDQQIKGLFASLRCFDCPET